jgi:hypothetical protein
MMGKFNQKRLVCEVADIITGNGCVVERYDEALERAEEIILLVDRNKETDDKYEIYDGMVIMSNGNIGSVLLDDEFWHPFRFFDNGDMDISNDGFIKPSSAFKMAEKTYT